MTATRWEVPYTAPGIKSGRLVVTASNREAAIAAAVDKHRRVHRKAGPLNRVALTIKERAAIDYGEPRPLDTAEVRP